MTSYFKIGLDSSTLVLKYKTFKKVYCAHMLKIWNLESEIEYAEKIRHKYSAMAGSEQIASRISILTVLFLLREKAPRYVLELGAGIGTLTQVFLEKNRGELETVETNNWCISQLQQNTKDLRSYLLTTDYSAIKSGSRAELICIDVNNGIFNVEKLLAISKNAKIIFIEGHHLAHRINISRQIRKNAKIQSLSDVRMIRGEKGCAYFEIYDDSSKLKWKSTASFIFTFVPLLLSFTVVKTRKIVGNFLNFLEVIPGVTTIRSLWKGKIPWNF